ncbi:MAG: Hsp70 family protein [Cycloclasticus sp.]|nr:Hsp70 family protein [Cycloclasticus sp.]
MDRTKIDYGIDLGTTNSAISRMENGEAVIKRSDTLKDTMPSCVAVNKKKAILVGESAFSAFKKEKLNAMKNFDSSKSSAFIEFKRTMGTDKSYACSNLGTEFTSEELSSEVLKKLKSFITDESINSIVVTVPAKFTVNQKDATLRAATLAGFKHCELLQEPIAASMAYGLDSDNKDGYWLVFDFGGGTFDAALLKVEEGIMKVIDTEGDNHLGGKNLDYAIVDDIILPYINDNYAVGTILQDDAKKKIFQDAMKQYADEAKVQMSFNDSHNILSDLGDIPGEDEDGEEFELDLTVTQNMMQETLGPIFQKSIDISISLLERNNLDGKSLDSLILVGGPTYSPILRAMLEEQITKPDLSIDPMTVVAKGAALFASTINVSDEVREKQRDKTKIQLELGYEATSVEDEEFVTVKILRDKTTGDIPEKLFVELVRNDAAWSSGKTQVDANGEVIEVSLSSGKSNGFAVVAYDEKGDLIDVEPSNFTILQGSKIGSATLPYSFGIEIKSMVSGQVVFSGIKGLEKNQSTPATGTMNGLKTQKQIRPGIKEDVLKIPLYQGEHGAEGTKAIHHEHVYDIVITGADLPKLLPEGSDVDITFKVDASERMSCSVYLPVLDHSEDIDVPSNTTQKEIDADWLESEIKKSLYTTNLIREEGSCSDEGKLNKLEADIEGIREDLQNNRTDYDRKKEVLNNLRNSLKTLDNIEAEGEWPKTEEELKDTFYRLEENDKQYGDEKVHTLVADLKVQVTQTIKDRDIKLASELIDTMRGINYMLLDKGLGVQMEISQLNYLNEDFDTLDWTDRSTARSVLDRGLNLAANDPVKDELEPIVRELYKLLPRADAPIVGGGDGTELVG